MTDQVVLKQQDFQNSRPLALAGYVIGQSISKEDYDRYMAEGSGNSTAPAVESSSTEDAAIEESGTAAADEAAQERDAMSAEETEKAEGQESPTKEAEEAAKAEGEKSE